MSRPILRHTVLRVRRAPARSGVAARAALIVLTCVLAAADCGQEQPEASATWSTVDSAGVVEVRLASLERVGEPLELSKLFTVGVAPTLNRVAGARLLGDGSLVVANGGNAEILWFDATGRPLRTVGTTGDGPGEYRSITAVLEGPADQVLVYDAGHSRMTVLGRDGQLVRTRPLSSGSPAVDLVPLTLLDDGSVLAVQGEIRVYSAGGGAVRDSTPLLRIDSTGASVDTAGFWKGKEWYYASVGRGIGRSRVGFGRDVVYGGRHGRVVVSSTDSLDVTVVGGDLKTVMRVRAPAREVAVSDEDGAAWQAQLTQRMESAPPELKALTTKIPAYDTYPDLEGVAISDAGDVWIGLRSEPGSEQDDWIIVPANGRDLRTTSLPKGARVLDVRGRKVAILHRDLMDQEFVTVDSIR